MAFSHYIRMAQTRSVCQFCEESPEIKWKCINCELLLCQLCCSKIHRNSKAYLEHEIINIKDIEEESFTSSVRKVDLENMVCTKHSKRKCFVYCNECSQPACSKCLTETHKMHDYISLDERHDEIILEMKELVKNIESKLDFFRYQTNKLQIILSNGDSNFQETRDIILQTEKEMKEAISKQANDLLQNLEEKWKPSEDRIKTELSELKKNENELETRKNNLNQALQSHQAADIFSTKKNLNKSMPKYIVKQNKLNKTKFIPRNMQVKMESQSMLGDLYMVPDLELIDTYQSDNRSVKKILSCSNNTAFIGSTSSEKLQRVKFENHKIKVEQEIQIKVVDMSLTQDKELLVSSGKCDLKQYTKDRQLKSFMTFSSLKTLGVHVTKDNKIIAGLAESYPVVIPPPQNCIRKLIIMYQNGDIQHTIEYDRDNHRLLTFPCRINSFDDKIVVVDIINTNVQGRVIMLDEGGQLLWTYNGCINGINSDQDKFYPTGLTITSSNIILVSDCNNHAIHVLNPTGDVIVCKDVQRLGIELPCSLDIDKDELLLVGTNHANAEDKIKKAKMHCVKLT